MGIGVARARSRAAHLVAIAATAAVIAAIGTSLVGVLESGLDAAVRAATAEPAARLAIQGESASSVEGSVASEFGGAPVTIVDGDDAAIVAPDVERVGVGDLAALRDGALGLPDALVADGVATRTAVSGDLAAWAQDLLDLAWRARLLAVMPLLVVLVVSAVAGRDVVRGLALSRVTEFVVVRSRGASRSRLVLENLREIAVVGAVGSCVGATVAGILTGAPALAVVVAAVAAPLLLTGIGVRIVRAAIPGDRSDESGEISGRSRAVGIVGLALLGVGTALALVRLTATGSATDPLGIAAPALGILAVAVLVFAAIAVLVRGADRAASRWRALGPALAVRRVARRLRMFGTVVVLVAIAAATTVFAAAFGATGEQVARELRDLRIGGDLLVADWPAGDDPDTLRADGVAPLLTNPGQLGDDEPLVLAADATRLAQALRPIAGLVEPGKLADLISAPVPGLELPDGTSALDITVEASDGVSVRVWLLEPNGRVRSAPIDGPIPGPASHVLAVDADVSRAAGAISLRLTSLVATTPEGPLAVELPATWEPQFSAFPDFESGRFATAADTIGFDLGRRSSADVDVRLMPPGEPLARIPAVVTRAFAERNGLDAGTDVDVRFAGTGRSVLANVAATVDALPVAGDRDAILVDYPAFAVQQLRITESVPAARSLVVATEDARTLRAEMASATGVTGREPATPDRMLGIARSLLWVAAVGSVALAVVGVASVSAALVAERRRETRILTVLGESASRQAAGQRVELGLTMTLALLGGTGLGAALSILVVPAFARAAAPGSGVLAATPLTVDPVAGGLLVATLVALLAGVVVGHGVRVRRDADRASGGAS